MRLPVPLLLLAVACSTPPAPPPPPPASTGGTLTGRVLAPMGGDVTAPAAGAEIALLGSRLAAIADADGRFRFTGLPRGHYALSYGWDRDGDGHRETGLRGTADVAPSADVGDVVLAPAGALRVVVEAAGSPVEAVPVAVAGLGTRVTGPDGSCTFDALYGGTYEVTAVVRTDGVDALVPVKTVVLPGGERQVVNLAVADLVAKGPVRAHVAGAPAGTKVQLGGEAAAVELPEKAGDSGTFEAADVPGGVYGLVVRAPGNVPVVVPAVFPGATLPDLVLVPSACLEARTGLCAALATGDADHDGIPDGRDVCPGTADADQADRDHDGVGDACSCRPRACTGRCGAMADGCGGTLDCGGCPGHDSCGAVEPNVCGCVPESDEELCAGVECGSLLVNDRCGHERAIEACGTGCTGFETCGGGGDPHACGCTPESDAELCATSLACGTVGYTDRCGGSRDVDCGCTAPATCGGGGDPGFCGCPALTDEAFCAQLGWTCGDFDGEYCGAFRHASCGTCAAPETCGGATPHECGARLAWDFEQPPLGSNALVSAMVAGPSRAWIAGSAGTVLRWDGAAWTRVDTGSAHGNTGVWALADDDVWVTAGRGNDGSGRVLHFDGTRWTRSKVAPEEFSGVWASGPGDVWAVSSYGGPEPAWHFDGGAWTSHDVHLPGSAALFSVSGSGPGDVWAVGYGAAVVHLENGTFVDHSPGPASLGSFSSVHARATDDVWMSGSLGSLYHWNGSTLAVVAKPSFYDPQGVWGDGPGTVLVAQPTNTASPMARWNGSSWTSGGAGAGSIIAIHGSGATAFGVGGNGAIARWGGGTTWTPQNTGLTSATLRGAWMADANEGWAVGDGGTALHLDGTGWHPVALAPAGLKVNAVWGSAANDVWLVGASGNAWHWDGSAMTRTQVDATGQELRAVWGAGPDDVWAAGGGQPPTNVAVLWHLSGGTWTKVTGYTAPPSFTAFVALAGTGPGDVWVAAANGLVQRWDGNAWATIRPAGGFAEYGLAVAAGEAFVANGQGVERWDGSAWTREKAGSFVAVLALGNGEAWASGDGLVWHRDGATGAWTPSFAGSSAALSGFAAAGGRVRAVGSAGTILRWRGP